MRGVWGVGVVALCAVGCGASNAGTPANSNGPAANAACPPPAAIAQLLGEGRIHRAAQAFTSVPERCRPALGDAWGEAALALAELGESKSATAEAERIDANPGATPGARRAAASAREHVARVSAKADDKNGMLEAYDRALDAEHEGKADVAISGYLEAWSRFRPNPQALIRVGRVHGRAGHKALAQRFYDRGVAELARATGKAPAAVGFSFDPEWDSAGVAWVPGERAISVKFGEQRRILDSNTLELLATYDAKSGNSALSPNGRFLATWPTCDTNCEVEVFHARSGHRLTALGVESRPSAAIFDPKSSRLVVVEESGNVGVFELPSGQRHARFDGLKGSHTRVDLEFLDEARLYAAFEQGRRQFVWNVDERKELWKRDNPDEWEDVARWGEKLVYLSVKRPKPGAKGKVDGKRRAELVTVNLTNGKPTKPVPLPGDASNFALATADVAVVAIEGGKAVAYRIDTGERLAHIELDKWERVDVSRGTTEGSVVLSDGDGHRGPRGWTPATNQASDIQEPAAMRDLFRYTLVRAASGRIVYLADPDTLIIVERDGTKKTSRRVRTAEVGGVSLSPTGEGIVLGDGRGIRSVSLGSARMGWLGERGLPNADLDFSADGKTLLAAGEPRLVVLDAKSGALRDQLAFAEPRDAHISADGTEVVAVDPERGVIWNLQSKTHHFEERGEAESKPSATTAMCCQDWVLGPDESPFQTAGKVESRGPHIQSGDGTRFAIVFQLEDEEDRGGFTEGISPAHGVDVFDAKSHARIARVHTGYETFVAELAIDYSGRLFATVSGVGGGAQLYQVDKKQGFYLGNLENLAFRRDGRLLAGVSREGVALHRTTDGKLLGSFLISRTDPDSAAFISHDGNVEWIGNPGAVDLGCLAGTIEVPFEACADRLVKPGLIQETFAAYTR